MTDYNQLFEESLRAYCMQCENWRVETFLGRAYGGCVCGMNAHKCSLNGLVQKLKEFRRDSGQ